VQILLLCMCPGCEGFNLSAFIEFIYMINHDGYRQLATADTWISGQPLSFLMCT